MPIVEIDYGEFLKAFEGLIKVKVLKTWQNQESVNNSTGIEGLQSIPLSSIIAVNGLKHGDEIQGTNPWHGSTTGCNFCLNTSLNVWHCFRCNSGGGVAKAIALNEEIIQECNDLLDGGAFCKVLNIAREKYGLSLHQTFI